MIIEKFKKATGFIAICRCDNCGIKFNKIFCGANRLKHQFCSRDCWFEYRGKNYRPSKETRLKMSLAQLGEKNHRYGKNVSEECKKKLRLARASMVFTEETKLKISLSNKGHIVTKETRKKIGRANKGKIAGDKHPCWKGGITSQNKIIRHSPEFEEWRKMVFKRDDYTCQECDKRGNGELHAHHIKSFARYPELRFEVDNGLTLCEDCHRKTFRKKLVA
jgi:hypothetical protein